jgi:hypothetical protein
VFRQPMALRPLRLSEGVLRTMPTRYHDGGERIRAKQNTVPTTPTGRVTAAEVRLEVTEETAQVLQEAADLAGFRPRLIVTCRGEALGEIVPIQDAVPATAAVRTEHLARVRALRGRLAHLPTSSADLAREKAREADWEDHA